MTKPMLLLDVDGPLNPWKMKPHDLAANGYTTHQITLDGQTYPVHLNPAHGTTLLALANLVDLVWTTTWVEHANTLISPILGLPTNLPVIPWPDGAQDAYRRGSWKTPHIAAWTAGKPFAWFDDEVNRYDKKYLAATNGIGPHLPVRVEPHTGLTEIHFAKVKAWAEAL